MGDMSDASDPGFVEPTNGYTFTLTLIYPSINLPFTPPTTQLSYKVTGKWGKGSLMCLGDMTLIEMTSEDMSLNLVGTG